MRTSQPIVQYAQHLNRLYDGIVRSQIDEGEERVKIEFYRQAAPICAIAWEAVAQDIAEQRKLTGIPFYTFETSEIEEYFKFGDLSHSEIHSNVDGFNPEGWCEFLFECLLFTFQPASSSLKTRQDLWTAPVIEATRNYLPIIIESENDESPNEILEITDDLIINVFIARLLEGFNSGIETLLRPTFEKLDAIGKSSADESCPFHEDSKAYLSDPDKIYQDIKNDIAELSSLTSMPLLFFGPFQSLLEGAIADHWQTLSFNSGVPEMQVNEHAKDQFTTLAMDYSTEFGNTKRKVCPFAQAQTTNNERAISQFCDWLTEIATKFMLPFVKTYYLHKTNEENSLGFKDTAQAFN